MSLHEFAYVYFVLVKSVYKGGIRSVDFRALKILCKSTEDPTLKRDLKAKKHKYVYVYFYQHLYIASFPKTVISKWCFKTILRFIFGWE